MSLPLISNDFEDGARSRQHPIVDTLTAAMELSILSRLYRGAFVKKRLDRGACEGGPAFFSLTTIVGKTRVG